MSTSTSRRSGAKKSTKQGKTSPPAPELTLKVGDTVRIHSSGHAKHMHIGPIESIDHTVNPPDIYVCGENWLEDDLVKLMTTKPLKFKVGEWVGFRDGAVDGEGNPGVGSGIIDQIDFEEGGFVYRIALQWWDEADLVKIAQSASEPQTAPAPSHDVQRIRVDLCAPSPKNPRIFRENDSFRQLVASIKEIGVASPIMVRPKPDFAKNYEYEIIFGERRWRACKALGLEFIPAIVRELSDHDAFILTITENMHREDITPLEESGAVASLLLEGFTLEQAAAQLGRSVSFVARRSKLSLLLDEWKALFSGENKKLDLSRWSASHMELVARMPIGTQKAALSGVLNRYHSDVEKWTLDELQRFLGDYIRLIKGAPWKLDAKVGDIQPCSTCSMRSSCQPELFADDEAIGGKGESGDVCLDGTCWDRKKVAFLKEREASLMAEHKGLKRVATEYLYERDKSKLGAMGKDVIESYSYEKVKKSDPGAQPALVVHGSDAGKVIYIKDKKSGGHGGGGGGQSKKTLAEKRKALQERRTKRAVGLVRDDLVSQAKVALKGGQTDLAFPAALAVASVFGVAEDNPRDEHFKEIDLWKRLDSTTTHDAEMKLIAKAFEKLEKLIAGNEFMDTYRCYKPEAVKVCELLGWNFQDYMTVATEEMPEPKAWAKEAEEEAKAAKSGKDQVKPSKGGKSRRVSGHDGKAAAAGEKPDDEDDKEVPAGVEDDEDYLEDEDPKDDLEGEE